MKKGLLLSKSRMVYYPEPDNFIENKVTVALDLSKN